MALASCKDVKRRQRYDHGQLRVEFTQLADRQGRRFCLGADVFGPDDAPALGGLLPKVARLLVALGDGDVPFTARQLADQSQPGDEPHAVRARIHYEARRLDRQAQPGDRRHGAQRPLDTAVVVRHGILDDERYFGRGFFLESTPVRPLAFVARDRGGTAFAAGESDRIQDLIDSHQLQVGLHAHDRAIEFLVAHDVAFVVAEDQHCRQPALGMRHPGDGYALHRRRKRAALGHGLAGDNHGPIRVVRVLDAHGRERPPPAIEKPAHAGRFNFEARLQRASVRGPNDQPFLSDLFHAADLGSVQHHERQVFPGVARHDARLRRQHPAAVFLFDRKRAGDFAGLRLVNVQKEIHDLFGFEAFQRDAAGELAYFRDLLQVRIAAQGHAVHDPALAAEKRQVFRSRRRLPFAVGEEKHDDAAIGVLAAAALEHLSGLAERFLEVGLAAIAEPFDLPVDMLLARGRQRPEAWQEVIGVTVVDNDGRPIAGLGVGADDHGGFFPPVELVVLTLAHAAGVINDQHDVQAFRDGAPCRCRRQPRRQAKSCQQGGQDQAGRAGARSTTNIHRDFS